MSEDRELGLVIIGIGCVLILYISAFGAMWVSFGLGWACVFGIAYSILVLLGVLRVLDQS